MKSSKSKDKKHFFMNMQTFSRLKHFHRSGLSSVEISVNSEPSIFF